MTDLAEKIRNRVGEPKSGRATAGRISLTRAVLAVLDLHVRVDAQRTFGDRRPVCKACDDGRSVPVWPCPTVTLMASALGVPGGQSDVE